MKIELRLHGDFRKYVEGSHDTLDLELADGATVNDVLEQLGVEDRDFWMSAVNREIAERNAELHDGDKVEFFGPVAGGERRSRVRVNGILKANHSPLRR